MDKILLYKLELICVKFTPILISFALIVNIVLNYFDIYLDCMSYIFGSSVMSIIPMYVSSHAFRFCKYHRMFIYFIVVILGVQAIDHYLVIPLDDFNLLLLYLGISGIFMYLVLYYHMKYGDRKVSFPSCYTSKKCGR